MNGIFPAPAPTDKACVQCGVVQPLTCYQFRKVEQTYRNTCKGCRAAEHRARRAHPANVERLREKERVRSAARRPAIRAWERAHPDNLRPGQQRRWARRTARLREARRLASGQPPAAAPPAAPPEAMLGPQGGVGGQNPWASTLPRPQSQ